MLDVIAIVLGLKELLDKEAALVIRHFLTVDLHQGQTGALELGDRLKLLAPLEKRRFNAAGLI